MKKGYITGMAFGAVLLWSSLFPAVKLGYQLYEIQAMADIFLFAGIRFSLCGLVITLCSFLKNRHAVKPLKEELPAVLLSGFFAVILHYGFCYAGLMLTDSSKSAILKQVGGLFYICFSFLFFKEDRPAVSKLAGAALGFGGILAINLGQGGAFFRIGDILILAASFSYVIANIISKKIFCRVDPVAGTGVSQLFGGIVLWLLGFFMGGRMRFAWDSSALVMLYICAASILAYCLWFLAVKEGELSRLFIIKFAEPVLTAVFSALLLQENIFKLSYLLSFILITSGILISNARAFEHFK